MKEKRTMKKVSNDATYDMSMKLEVYIDERGGFCYAFDVLLTSQYSHSSIMYTTALAITLLSSVLALPTAIPSPSPAPVPAGGVGVRANDTPPVYHTMTDCE